MKIAVVGSRSFDDYEYMKKVLNGLLYIFDFTEIVSGGARGADALADKYGYEHGIPRTIFEPDWDLYGKSAGYKRNKQIVDYADMVVAFWDGASKGTLHSINLAKTSAKSVMIFTDWKD